MSILANTELTRLRQQMAALKPGIVTDATETVAPLVTRVLGYAELASAVLPQIRRAMDRGRASTVTSAAASALPVLGRSRSWRGRALAVGLPALAVVAAYAAWRFRPATATRVRPKSPPG